MSDCRSRFWELANDRIVGQLGASKYSLIYLEGISFYSDKKRQNQFKKSNKKNVEKAEESDIISVMKIIQDGFR